MRVAGVGGELGQQRSKARGEPGGVLGQGLGVGPKSVKGLKIKGKLFYIFRIVNLYKFLLN